MTAHEPTHSPSENSGERPDAQALLDHTRDRGHVSLQGLATRAGLTEARTKTLLEALEAQNLVDVTPGFQAVHITPTDTNRDYQPSTVDDVRADGGHTDGDDTGEHEGGQGPLHRMVDAITPDPVQLPVTETEFYDVVSNTRRRRLIRLVAALTDPDGDTTYISTRTAAHFLAVAETSEPAPTAEETHRCYVAITQTHAPLLDELGLLEYHDRVQKLGGTEDTVLLERLLNQNRDVCQGGDDADHGGAGVL